MSIGYIRAEDSVHPSVYNDNWMRTFGNIPEFTPNELKMIKEWVAKNELGKVALYLTTDRFGKNFDLDMTEFVIREILRENL